MLIMKYIMKMINLISKIISKVKKKLPKHQSCNEKKIQTFNLQKQHSLIIFVATIIVTAVLIIQSFYVPAYAIKVNGENIGIVADTELYESAVDYVETQATEILGKEYKLDENTEFSLTLTAKDELASVNELKTSLLRQVDELKKNYVLTVNGETIGASEDKAVLQDLLNKVASQYTNESTIEYQFEQDVSITYDYTSIDTQSDLTAIYKMLTSNTEEVVTYTAVKGDTYSEIASEHGMKLNELMELNPNADLDKLMIGDVIIIKKPVPFLSIRTVNKLTYTEPIESPIEYIEDTSMYVGDSKTKIKGTDGYAQITAYVTYMNGKEINRKVIDTITIEEPTKTVIAKGITPRPKTASYGTYIWPVSGKITSRTGNRYIFGGMSYHAGLDIAAPYGTAVKASDGGRVTFSGWSGDYGNLVIITHDNGTQTYYAHNSSLLVSTGERVYQGQSIAKVGSTGLSTGNHSHFEVRANGSIRNPYDYLS